MRRSFAFFALLVVGHATTAEAQEDDKVPLGEFSVQTFSPAPGAHNFLQVDGARVEGHLGPSVGLTLDYAHEPFVIVRCPSETSCDFDRTETELVEYQFTSFLHGAVTLVDRIQVGLVVPLALSSGEAFERSVGEVGEGERVLVGGGSAFGLGDPRLSVKASLFDQGPEGLDVAAVAYFTAPLGQATTDQSFIGDGSPRVGGHAVGEFTKEGFRVAANLGGFWRSSETLFSTRTGSQLTYALAFGYDVTPLVSVFGELAGSATFSSQLDENPLEGRIAGRYRTGDFVLTLAAGTGLVRGVGMPLVRITGAAAWQPRRTDADEDGVLDTNDACPSEAEDADLFQDDDGCPDPDNDGDGLQDEDDPCPLEGEDQDGFQDDDGCADPDNDGDGITDGFDSCPDTPEDMDGDRDQDGCPDQDTDRDGISDGEDACPEEPEDTDGFGDLDGCPEEDFDLDGIADTEDHCPDQAEMFNGHEDEDGCPEEDGDGDAIPDAVDQCPERAETYNDMADSDGCPDGDAAVELEGDQIRLLMQPEFRRGANLTGRARRVLNAVATVLDRNRHLRRIRVEAHTDDRRNAEGNMELSRERAEAVLEHLVSQGVARERLQAVGHGDGQPAEGQPADRIELQVEPLTPGTEGAPRGGANGAPAAPAPAEAATETPADEPPVEAADEPSEAGSPAP